MGIESEDIPEFVENVIYPGLGLVDTFVLPHADSVYFEKANIEAREIHGTDLIELNDNQALIINGPNKKIVSGTSE